MFYKSLFSCLMILCIHYYDKWGGKWHCDNHRLIKFISYETHNFQNRQWNRDDNKISTVLLHTQQLVYLFNFIMTKGHFVSRQMSWAENVNTLFKPFIFVNNECLYQRVTKHTKMIFKRFSRKQHDNAKSKTNRTNNSTQNNIEN